MNAVAPYLDPLPLIAVLHRTPGGFRNVFLVLAALAAAMLVCSLSSMACSDVMPFS